MRPPLFRRSIAAGLLALAFAAASPFAAAEIRAPWLNEPYTYVGSGESIQRVLRTFARQFALNVDIDTEVDDPINGEIAEQTPNKFLDRLASMYGFDWYLDNGTLYISAIGKRERRIIKAPSAVIRQLRGALEGAGVYQNRFGWGELVGQGQLLVYGPPAYVDRLTQTVDMIAAAPSGFEIGLFPLKYANVDDRTIRYRDKETTIPGVASIVRGIAGGVPDPAAGNAPPSSPSPAADTDAGSVGGIDLPGASAPNAGTASTNTSAGVDTGAWRSAQGDVIIQSDVRMNALIVKAPHEMLAFYKSLIEQLDVDVPLVQIEVTILDIDSAYLDDVGINWALDNTGGGRNLFKAAPLQAAINTILPGGLNLYAQINLLQQNGRGEVISKPSLLTMDNTAALFDSNETSYIRTQGERVAETKEVSAGLMFKVVPRVIRDDTPGRPGRRKILLQIDIEDGKRLNAMNADLPVFKKSTISTQAIVGDTESLLIAGHQHQERQTSVSRVPFLGSLPLIGALFRNESETSGRRTRFFIITPRIVNTLQLDNEAALPVFEKARAMRAGSDSSDTEKNDDSGNKAPPPAPTTVLGDMPDNAPGHAAKADPAASQAAGNPR
jgi:type III secretion protein C